MYRTTHINDMFPDPTNITAAIYLCEKKAALLLEVTAGVMLILLCSSYRKHVFLPRLLAICLLVLVAHRVTCIVGECSTPFCE